MHVSSIGGGTSDPIEELVASEGNEHVRRQLERVRGMGAPLATPWRRELTDEERGEMVRRLNTGPTVDPTTGQPLRAGDPDEERTRFYQAHADNALSILQRLERERTAMLSEEERAEIARVEAFGANLREAASQPVPEEGVARIQRAPYPVPTQYELDFIRGESQFRGVTRTPFTPQSILAITPIAPGDRMEYTVGAGQPRAYRGRGTYQSSEPPNVPIWGGHVDRPTPSPEDLILPLADPVYEYDIPRDPTVGAFSEEEVGTVFQALAALNHVDSMQPRYSSDAANDIFYQTRKRLLATLHHVGFSNNHMQT